MHAELLPMQRYVQLAETDKQQQEEMKEEDICLNRRLHVDSLDHFVVSVC